MMRPSLRVLVLVTGFLLLSGCGSTSKSGSISTHKFATTNQAMSALSKHLDKYANANKWVTSHGVGLGVNNLEVSVGANEQTEAAAKQHCAPLNTDIKNFLGATSYTLTIESWVSKPDGSYGQGDWSNFTC